MTSGSAHASGYESPDALWTAVTAKIQAAAKADPQLNISNLQRQFVYHRFLARIFALGDGDWVLKGGTALLARVRSARHSKDIDLYRKSGSIDTALAELERATELDLGDHFRFVITAPPVITNQRQGQPNSTLATVPIDAYAGVRLVSNFKIDLVIGVIITAEPDRIPATPPVTIPGLPSSDYLVYPLVDHIADKLCATIETHGQHSTPSTRVRDLVDLVVIANTQVVEAAALHQAIEAERLHRNLGPITSYSTPASWAQQYARLARAVPDCFKHQTYRLALDLIAEFLDPILKEQVAAGSWDPRAGIWTT